MGLNYYQIKKKVLEARKLVIQATSAAGSGHPGGTFSMAEILGCLFFKYLRYDPKNPSWEDSRFPYIFPVKSQHFSNFDPKSTKRQQNHKNR